MIIALALSTAVAFGMGGKPEALSTHCDNGEIGAAFRTENVAVNRASVEQYARTAYKGGLCGCLIFPETDIQCQNEWNARADSGTACKFFFRERSNLRNIFAVFNDRPADPELKLSGWRLPYILEDHLKSDRTTATIWDDFGFLNVNVGAGLGFANRLGKSGLFPSLVKCGIVCRQRLANEESSLKREECNGDPSPCGNPLRRRIIPDGAIIAFALVWITAGGIWATRWAVPKDKHNED